MADAYELVETLNSFGSALELRKFLAGNGIKGWKQDESSCPISNWVHRELNSEEWTCVQVVTEDKITVYKDYNDVEEYKIGNIVNEFIRNFDDGYYPELEFEYEEYWD